MLCCKQITIYSSFGNEEEKEEKKSRKRIASNTLIRAFTQYFYKTKKNKLFIF